MDQWIPPIEAEFESLFQKKGALAKISQEEVQRLVANDLAEVLPSKLGLHHQAFCRIERWKAKGQIG